MRLRTCLISIIIFIVHIMTSLLFKNKITPGKDGLLLWSLQYYLLPLLMLGAYFSSQNVHAYFWLFVIYALLPLFDELFTLDWKNPTEQERQQLEQRDPYFKMGLYLSIFVDWAIFFKMLQHFSEIDWTLNNAFQIVGLLFLTSNIGAVSFLVAHEIFHKMGTFNKVLGTLHMAKTMYMHFTIQHLYGHHKNVATQKDPASAQKGITVYEFIPRSIIGSWLSAYEIQKSKGKSIFTNGAVLSIIFSIISSVLVYKYYSWKGLVFFLVYTAISIVYLEGINYIEHYGLRRNKLSNGQYEKVTIRHSWNAPHRITNYFLFKLQRHSDHHQNSLKPYQTLLSLEDSPHLPHGYTVMILMCFFPSVFFKIMDPLVDEYEKKKQGQIDTIETKRSQELTIEFIKKVALIVSVLAVMATITTK